MVDTIGMTNAVGGAPSYNGRMLRQLNAVGFAGATAARPLGARSGVRPGTPSTTVTATSTTWTVQPFAGLLDGQSAAEAGPYAFAFDAVATGAVTAASASIARVDIVYVQVDDPSESDGSTVPAVTRKYLAGTVASTAPTLPARSILLAHINVPISGGGAPTVTWKAPYCAAAGGVVDFNTTAEMDATTTLPAGTRAYVRATKGEYVFNGGNWQGTTYIQYTSTGVVPWGSLGKVTAMTVAAATDISAFTWSAGTFTCVRPGRYKVEAKQTLTNTAGAASLYLRKGTGGAAAVAISEVGAFGATSGTSTVSIAETLDFEVGDTLELWQIGSPVNAGAGTGNGNRITITDA